MLRSSPLVRPSPPSASRSPPAFSLCLVPFISSIPFRISLSLLLPSLPPLLLYLTESAAQSRAVSLVMSADLYPQSAYAPRSSYQSRPDPSYQLSTPSNVVYPPQLMPSQPPLSDPQTPDASNNPSPRESQSPKQDSASPPKQDGNAQQQPAKPQATFLTKLYA